MPVLEAKKGAIHVNAGCTGRALCQAVLDLDRLVDLRVCVLKAAAYLAQTPSSGRCDHCIRLSVLYFPFSETSPVKMKDGDTRAEFQEIQRLSVIENTAVNNSPAACVLSSDERYLIVSNRGENTLVLYSVDFRTGFLTEQHRVATAAMPRDILITDTSVIVAAQSANSVQLFSLDTDRHQLHLCSAVDGVQSPVVSMMTA